MFVALSGFLFGVDHCVVRDLRIRHRDHLFADIDVDECLLLNAMLASASIDAGSIE
jgi:hypothetical protein